MGRPLTPKQQEEEDVQRLMRTCIHYRSRHRYPACEADVDYESVTHPELPFPERMPCLSGAAKVPCALARFPDRAEAEAISRQQREETAVLVERINKCAEAILAATGGAWDVAGKLQCPCCEGGTLHYGVSGHNGHMSAHCTTDGCARWNN